jgi:hypothetical protein
VRNVATTVTHCAGVTSLRSDSLDCSHVKYRNFENLAALYSVPSLGKKNQAMSSATQSQQRPAERPSIYLRHARLTAEDGHEPS